MADDKTKRGSPDNKRLSKGEPLRNGVREIEAGVAGTQGPAGGSKRRQDGTRPPAQRRRIERTAAKKRATARSAPAAGTRSRKSSSSSRQVVVGEREVGLAGDEANQRRPRARTRPRHRRRAARPTRRRASGRPRTRRRARCGRPTRSTFSPTTISRSARSSSSTRSWPRRKRLPSSAGRSRRRSAAC